MSKIDQQTLSYCHSMIIKIHGIKLAQQL